MNILINALSARLGGGITVIRNLLPALLAEDAGAHRYTVVSRDDTAAALDPHHDRVRMHRVRSHSKLGARALDEQVMLPLIALRERAHVQLSPAGLATFASPVPQVLVYQNMAPFDESVIARADHKKQLRLRSLRTLGIASAHAVKRIVFISRFAQRSIIPIASADARRTRCVYLGRDGNFVPSAADRSKEKLGSLGISGRYVLSVSQFYHYKNFVELVEGFALALPDLPPDLTLVIAGAEAEPEYAERVRRTIRDLGIEGRVKIIGHIPYEELPVLYASAFLFVFPSTCENFPNILVEALSSGAPTLSSKAGPMPEIADDGAAYFDPFAPRDIARVLVEYAQNDEARLALRERGIARASRYSWNATARGVLQALEEAR